MCRYIFSLCIVTIRVCRFLPLFMFFVVSDMATHPGRLDIPHYELFEAWCSESESANRNTSVYRHVEQQLGLQINRETSGKELPSSIRKRCDTFCAHVKAKWVQANRCKKTFVRKNGAWLQKVFVIEPTVVPLPSSPLHRVFLVHASWFLLRTIILRVYIFQSTPLHVFFSFCCCLQ